MKKILYLIGGFLALPLVLTLVMLFVLFIDPTVIVNESNLSWVLTKTKVLETWSWKKLDIRHDWKKWNDRRLSGEIRDLCLVYSKGHRLDTCIEEISWDFDLRFSFGDGFSTVTYSPFVIHSSRLDLTLVPSTEEKEGSGPPDIYRYWSLLWSGIVPDVDVRLQRIAVTSEGKTTALDLGLSKKKDLLEAEALKYRLSANPEGFVITAPPVLVPEKIETVGPFYVRNIALTGKVSEEGIPLHLTGNLEEAGFDIRASLALPLKHELSSLTFRREFLSTVSGQVRLPDFREAYKNRAPASYQELPAPLNVMNGSIVMTFQVKKGSEGFVTFTSGTRIDLSSKKEVLDLTIEGDSDLPVETLRPDAVRVGLEFHRVKLELPRLSKKSAPPQFLPDKRFKKGAYAPPVEEEAATDVEIHLTALNRKSLHLVTNLLDEPLRLNFDLLIGNGKVRKGHVTALPLKTEIFRRPIHVKSLVVTFDEPKDPVITAVIQFPLPEYRITLDLEGPVDSPRYSFRSEPPLPQNDIFAVLLFGRPMSELDTEDKTSAQKTNEILSQGILSLSVLYFLAGSPVEYVGFDPDSQTATAQFGLTSRTSLRVGGGREGMNSGGIRHSLGKGWYIDTTVQDEENPARKRRNDYGVLLERVIAY